MPDLLAIASERLLPVFEWYSTQKRSLGDLTGASEELLHVHAGLLIFVISALLLRRKMRSPIPLVVVALFAALNEVVDALTGPMDWLEAVTDFLNTVFWPFVLFLLARRWR